MSQRLNDEYAKKTILTLPDKDSGDENYLSIGDAMRGISILGATGSGKTSASGRILALNFLNEGWGGIVLTVKPDEVKLWEKYCARTGRLKDLVIFGHGSVHKTGKHKGKPIVFNPLDYELQREGEGKGNTQNIVNIFMNIYRMGNRIAQEGDISKEERFWDSALKRCIAKVIELLKLAEEPLSMKNIYNILVSCASKDENGSVLTEYTKEHCDLVIKEKADESTALKYTNVIYTCPLLIAKADKQIRNVKDSLSTVEYEYRRNMYMQVKDYFFQFMNSMSERTKATIIEMFMGLSEPFLSGILNRHFSGVTNIFPEDTFKGKIIVINFPVKEFLDIGIIAQCVFKLMYQQAVERRKIANNTMPVFIWADEAHMFVNPYDQLFLTTARGALCSTVYLTQSISNYLAVMGSGSDSKSKVDSLLGNLTTKIFHANSDAETNEYASRLIGNDERSLENLNVSNPLYDMNIQTSKGYSTQYLPQIQPREFTTLPTGGPENDGYVEAVVFSMGKTWTTKKNFIITGFDQEKLNNEK